MQTEWDESFFRTRLLDKSRVLKPRKTQCDSCPVNDMYQEIAAGLKRCPDELRIAYSKTWFCHTSPRKACRGNWDFQNLGGVEDDV